MPRRQLFQYFTYAALALCLVGFISAVRKLQTAQALVAEALPELARAKQELQRLQQFRADEQKRRAVQPALSDPEVLELARLRAEVTRLRNEQRAIQNVRPAPSGLKSPAASVFEATGTFLGVTTLSTSVSATVGVGHSIAVGGWESPTPGKRIVALVTPEIDRLASEPPIDKVAVSTQILEMSNATFEQLGLGVLRSGQANSQSQAVFTPEQMKTLIERAKQAGDTDALAAPRVITVSGSMAQVAIVDLRADGVEIGPRITITPTVDATRTCVRLDMDIRLTLPAPATPAP